MYEIVQNRTKNNRMANLMTLLG